MNELLELVEERRREEWRLEALLTPIAVAFPFTYPTVRATFDRLRRDLPEPDAVRATQLFCEWAMKAGVAPDVIAHSIDTPRRGESNV